MILWTNEDINKILIQLDELGYPFPKYSLTQSEGQLNRLGKGGSAYVFEAVKRSSGKGNFALKVIGFGKQNSDSDFFNEAVEAQKDIGDYQEDVVRVYDHTELWVTFDESDNVVTVENEAPETMSPRCLKLQFIVMEKISSVIERANDGSIKLTPEILGTGDEREILKLAYDVGSALQRAHSKKILHRDVKLENVFYSEKDKTYKLGDFGIAKKTEDGFAKTIAFTNGYVAPEVRTTPENERYDNTADIYSFGMMLFVLANNLKFPDSNSYSSNQELQYSKGYMLPPPEFEVTGDLYYIMSKACMYNPDDRYQSMEEMLLDIQKLLYTDGLGYKVEHKNVSLGVGTVFLAVGVVAWKLTMKPELTIIFSLMEYIFWLGCVGKGLLKIARKETGVVTFVMFCVGIYLLITTGFTWWKLLLFLWMIGSSGNTSIFVGGAALIANCVSLIQNTGQFTQSYFEYNWVTITTLSFGIFLLFQYWLLTLDDRKTVQMYYKKGFYWLGVCAFYMVMLMWGMNHSSFLMDFYSRILGENIINVLHTYNVGMAGTAGIILCALWILRERFLIYRQKQYIAKMNAMYENEYIE